MLLHDVVMNTPTLDEFHRDASPSPMKRFMIGRRAHLIVRRDDDALQKKKRLIPSTAHNKLKSNTTYLFYFI